MTGKPALRIVAGMANAHDDDGSERKAEGVFIGEALQRLARDLGVPNPRQFALRFGIPYKHLNNLWTNTRHAGLPTIVEIARKSGRAVAYFLGEEGAKPLLGSMDAIGRISMASRLSVPGYIHLPEACGPFAAGARLVMEPSAHRADVWLVVRSVGSDETWIAWSRDHAGLALLVRPSGESVLYAPQHHEIIGAIVDVIVAPPAGPSA